MKYLADTPYSYAKYIQEHDDPPGWDESACSGGIRHVRTVVQAIQEAGIEPLCIGVFGEWGTGKTSVLQAVKAYYDAHPTIGNPVVFFEAWRYSSERVPPIVPLFQRIAEQERWPQADRESLRAIARSLLGIGIEAGLSAVSTGIAAASRGLFHGDLAQAYHRARNSVADGVLEQTAEIDRVSRRLENIVRATLEPNNGRLIILVDDLDRADPDRAWELLQGLRFYFTIPRVVVCLGLDDTVVARIIERRYGKEVSGRDFLRKIVNLEVELGRVPFVAGGPGDPEWTMPEKEAAALAGTFPPMAFRTWRRIRNAYDINLGAFPRSPGACVFLALLQECFPEADFELRCRPALRDLLATTFDATYGLPLDTLKLRSPEVHALLTGRTGKSNLGEDGCDVIAKIWTGTSSAAPAARRTSRGRTRGGAVRKRS